MFEFGTLTSAIVAARAYTVPHMAAIFFKVYFGAYAMGQYPGAGRLFINGLLATS